ncbi:ribosome silencing factor [Corynebacterium sp.]|uniref:ribosome silencing factor n=1 Tax=Corynebacterium sp. TaxID=1720 RepID=UPI0026DBF4E9|nr:ribosome silencing factor [Corynebacterium sp.]MDO5076111.1 ribosome silencing factor [Corynebacterium sp.]
MTASDYSLSLARTAALAADDKRGTDIAVIDVSDNLVITDCFVIISADNERHLGSIVDEVEDKLRELGAKPVRREGVREGRWALLDYSDIVVHVQRNEEREFYALDRLWRDCPLIDIEGIETPVRPAAWAGDVDVRSAASIDDIPLADKEPDADEL